MLVIAGGAFVICISVISLGLYCLHRLVQQLHSLLFRLVVAAFRPYVRVWELGSACKTILLVSLYC